MMNQLVNSKPKYFFKIGHSLSGLGFQHLPRGHAHTCHRLWTKICEIRQVFKGDLIKFYKIFTKNNLELPQNSQKPLFKCKKLVINTTKCDLCLFQYNMCCKIF